MSRQDQSNLSNQTSPNYADVDRILRESGGNPAPLKDAYPNFDPETIVPESKFNGPPWNYLHYAAFHNAPITVMEGLLSCGASLKQLGTNRCTVLMNACSGTEISRAQLVRWILSQPDGLETLNQESKSGFPPLLYALRPDPLNSKQRLINIPVSLALIEYGASPVKQNSAPIFDPATVKNQRYFANLIRYVVGLKKGAVNSVKIVSRLLAEYRADPDFLIEQGVSLLHYATRFAKVDIVKLLLAHGANPTRLSMHTEPKKQGKLPRDFAVNLIRSILRKDKYPEADQRIIGELQEEYDCEGPKELAEKLNKELVETLKRAERVFSILAIGEWRPHKHARFPEQYRRAMRTLLILARARVEGSERESILSYPQVCLCLLPEELLQYLYTFCTDPPVPDCWAQRLFSEAASQKKPLGSTTTQTTYTSM